MKIENLYVPVRIDPFGGLADLQSFRDKVGCNLVNFAIDLYEVNGAKIGVFFEVSRIHEKAIKLFVNDELVDSVSTINCIYSYKESSLSHVARLFRSLLFNLYSRSDIRNLLLKGNFFKEVDFGIEIRVLNTCPISSGLGTSGAFCAGLFRILYEYFSFHDLIKLSKNYKELGWRIIYESEVLLSGFEAGFQDQVASIYGGVTHLYSDPNVQDNSVFRDRQEIGNSIFWSDLQEKAILIYFPRTKSSSETLKTIKKIAERTPKKFNRFLLQAKLKQKEFYKFLVSSHSNNKNIYARFAQTVKECWKLRSEILFEVASPLAHFITKQNFPILSFRECGAGNGGCNLILFPTSNTKNKIKKVFDKCKSIFPEIKLYRFRFNNEGIADFQN